MRVCWRGQGFLKEGLGCCHSQHPQVRQVFICLTYLTWSHQYSIGAGLFLLLSCFYPRGKHTAGVCSTAWPRCHHATRRQQKGTPLQGLTGSPASQEQVQPLNLAKKDPASRGNSPLDFCCLNTEGNWADTQLAQHGETATCHVLPRNGPASCPKHRNNTSLSIFMAHFWVPAMEWLVQGKGCGGAGCSRATQVSRLQHPSPGAGLRHQLEGCEGELRHREATCY